MPRKAPTPILRVDNSYQDSESNRKQLTRNMKAAYVLAVRNFLSLHLNEQEKRELKKVVDAMGGTYGGKD